MARPLRIEYPDAFYHVMNRGQRQDAIVDDAYDRKRLLCCLDEDESAVCGSDPRLLPQATTSYQRE
jgi:hypothetical protein